MEDNILFYEFNLNKLVFQKKRKTYFIYEFDNFKTRNIKFKSVRMHIPFGIEKYNSKFILNLEFYDYDKNNYTYNQIMEIKNLELYFKDLLDKKISLSLKEDLENKTFCSSIKERKNSFLLRTHLKVQKKNIISEFKKKDKFIELNSLKNSYGQFQIELKSLWISKDQYGLVWVIKQGEII